MNKKLLFTVFGLLLLFSFKINAQVSGLSYTLSPAAEYVWWNDRAGIENNYLVGGKLGFGFGEYLELRATYMRSLDLQTDFSNFGIENFADDLFESRDAEIVRIGGELKANLSRGNLLPFVTIGTGVQSIELDGDEAFMKNEQIFVNAGAGITLSIADRYNLLVQARNTQYRFNSIQNLLTPDDRTKLGIAEGTFGQEDLGNWSVEASLQFYLGGRRPGELSELDKAYFQSLNSGFRGLQGTIEPVVGNIDFNDMLPFRDTWLAGGSAGLNFGPFVELRGFYLQAMEDGDFGTSFDPLAVYGGELRMKLNAGGGLLPYLIVGGGNIDVQEDEYVARTIVMDGGQDSLLVAEDKGFVMGGLGLLLPISRNVNVFGSARALVTSAAEIDDIQQPDELNTSWMYNAGFRFTFGKRAQDPTRIVDNRMSDALAAQQSANDIEAENLKTRYEVRLIELERQLNDAYAEQDAVKAASIQREKAQAEEVIAELNRRAANNGNSFNLNNIGSGGVVQMSPAEFENIIDEILDGMGAQGSRIAPQVQQQLSGTDKMEAILRQQETDRKMEEIEKQLFQIGERQKSQDKEIRRQLNDDLNEFSRRMMNEMQRLNQKMDNTQQDIRRMNSGGTGTDVIDGNSNSLAPNNPNGSQLNPNDPSAPLITTYVPNYTPIGQDTLPSNSFFRKVRYRGASTFAGFNLGGGTTANLGFRWHYGLGNSPIEFMPEAFFGFGSPASFGLTGNFVLPFSLNGGTLRPYIGTGGGFMQIEDDEDAALKGAFNIILGSYVNIGRGRVYVDLTGRNLFRNNQLAIGYRLPF